MQYCEIPVMYGYVILVAVEADVSWSQIHAGTSTLSGAYIVEEKPINPSIDNSDVYRYCTIVCTCGALDTHQCLRMHRRLIFLQNQHFIQSEARLHHSPTTLSASQKKKQRKQRSKLAAAGVCEDTDRDSSARQIAKKVGPKMDTRYLDPHHVVVLIALEMASVCAPLQQYTGDIVVIGLGGGGLSMCLQQFVQCTEGMRGSSSGSVGSRGTPTRIITCDLDPAVVTVAKEFFGYQDGDVEAANVGNHDVPCLTVVGDGVELLHDIHAQHAGVSARSPMAPVVLPLSLVCIDVDAKDTTAGGITAPPAGFITLDMIHKVHSILNAHNGVLVVNVVSHDTASFELLYTRIVSVFTGATGEEHPDSKMSGHVCKVKSSDESINVSIVAVRCDKQIVKHMHRGASGEGDVSEICALSTDMQQAIVTGASNKKAGKAFNTAEDVDNYVFLSNEMKLAIRATFEVYAKKQLVRICFYASVICFIGCFVCVVPVYIRIYSVTVQ